MSIIMCRKCGRQTNTAVCYHIHLRDDMADECYAAFVDGKWVPGCASDKSPEYIKLSMEKFFEEVGDV